MTLSPSSCYIMFDAVNLTNGRCVKPTSLTGRVEFYCAVWTDWNSDAFASCCRKLYGYCIDRRAKRLSKNCGALCWLLEWKRQVLLFSIYSVDFLSTDWLLKRIISLFAKSSDCLTKRVNILLWISCWLIWLKKRVKLYSAYYRLTDRVQTKHFWI